jgi:hypothetical protein
MLGAALSFEISVARQEQEQGQGQGQGQEQGQDYFPAGDALPRGLDLDEAHLSVALGIDAVLEKREREGRHGQKE